MRVDIVTDTFLPDVNGVAMTLGHLSAGLRRRGHLVHVIRSGPTGDAKFETGTPSLPLPGYPEVRVGLPGPFKLRRRWSRKRPDAVYVATESPLGHSALKAAESLGIPVAAGFHTNFHEYAEEYRLAGLGPIAMSYLRHVHRRADLTFAPSPEVVAMLRERGFPQVRLLGRGVDPDLFHPGRRDVGLRSTWGARPGTPVAMLVGRVAPEKNPALAMECFRRMREAVPDVRCVVVGDGPLRESLFRGFPWVHFAGLRRDLDLATHYASADVLLFPSVTETFGNVLLEGMASGLVTVSFDYAAAGQHIRDRHNGLTARKGDCDRFVRLAIEALDARAHGAMRAEARRTALALAWDRVVDTFESALVEICDRRRTTVPGVARSSRQREPREPLKVRSVFISDVHLGTTDSKVREVTDFLRHIRCEKLVLNGDIIDGWALTRGGKWRKRHTRFIRVVLKKSEREKTRVVYLRGNHDEILDRFLPLRFGAIEFAKEHIHEAVDGKRYLVVHGDGFDSVSTNHRWLAVLGALGYDSLLRLNRWYNRWRVWRGKESFSLSKFVKAKVKSAVSYIDCYEQQLQDFARKRGCEGIICGHIHTPDDKQVGGIHYLNSGDWVESLTAIVEHHDGRLELLSYNQFLERLACAHRAPAAAEPAATRHALPWGNRPFRASNPNGVAPLAPEQTAATPLGL